MLRQFGKFLIIGGISTLINYGVFFGLYTWMHADYLVAAVIGYMTGLLFGFLYNRRWTFCSTTQKKYHEFASYFGVYIISLGLSMLFLYVLVEYAMMTPLLANIFAIGLSTVTNFIGCKMIVFRPSKISI